MTENDKKPPGRKQKYGEPTFQRNPRWPQRYWDVVLADDFDPVLDKASTDPAYLQTIKKLAAEPDDQP